jgi:DNA-binding MarR family transcriptional regulator
MISNKLSRGSSRLYIRKFGIGVIEWRILGFLKSNGSASAKNICQTLAIDKSAASRSIQELESKQLISVSPIDRRQRALSLTNKGRSLHDQVLPVALERERILLSLLAEKEREQLLRLLRKLRACITAINAARSRMAWGAAKQRKLMKTASARTSKRVASFGPNASFVNGISNALYREE